MKILKLEWLKLRGHNFFWIGGGIFVLLMLLLTTQFGKVTLLPTQEEGQGMVTFDNFADAGIYKLPYLWHNLTYVASWLKFIPAFLLLFFVSNEFSYKTYRQNVIDGLSVGKFYWGKILYSILFSLFAVLLLIVCGLVMGLQYNAGAGLAGYLQHTDYLLAYFAEVWCFTVFALFLTFLFKRSTISIIVVIGYYIFVEPILGFILGEPLKFYLPLAPSRELILWPFNRLFQFDEFLGTVTPDSVSLKYLLLTLAYSLVFVAGGFLVLKRRDL